ncbi:MAG: Ppx/GppA phosphatase family protein [Myxococcota bacterium]
MPRFAAIDVGSNAMRLLIVQAKEPTRIRPFRSMRFPVRLGHGVFQTGRLNPHAIDECVEAMRAFADAMEDAKVDDYRAVVTASARSASNADVLFDRIREETGIALNAISGTEEARLVGMAVRDVWPIEGRTLLMDLGGGSLEISDLSDGGFTVSLAIGTVRILEAFLEPGAPIDQQQDHLVREYVDRLLAPHRRKLRQANWDHVIGTGGNLVAASQLCPVEGAQVPTIDVEKARELRGVLAGLTKAERVAQYNLKADRADVIVPALYVIVAMADLAKVNAIEVPGVGLKDGIVKELVQKHYRVWDYGREDDKVVAAAIQLGRRYHFDERYALHTAAIADRIFEGTQKLHRLGEKSRAMLKVAALLHNIGVFINQQSHHKHSQYIIENSDLMGPSPETRRMIALIARYHRRATPSPRHTAYRSLNSSDRDRVKNLAAILRVAIALDRGHLGKVTVDNVKIKRGTVVIEVSAATDISLEIWTVERKADLFRDVFGRDVRIKVNSNEERAAE